MDFHLDYIAIIIDLSTCRSSIQGYNIQDIAGAAEPGMPDQEARDWYQYYFHTERGRKGLDEKRDEIARFLWKTWSPSWSFDDDTFKRSAASFDNPDFVDVVIHSYRHRYGLIAGDPDYEEIEARLSRQPDISVSTIVLLGADDGVDPPSSKDQDAREFIGFYARRVLPGIGHNVPQEAPTCFANAIQELRAISGSVSAFDLRSTNHSELPAPQRLQTPRQA